MRRLAVALATVFASGAVIAHPTDFCYERSHFALMVAEDRDAFRSKRTDEDEDFAKSAWRSILQDHSQRDIDAHIDIIVTVWEVMQQQTPSEIEAVTLHDCLKRPQRYR
ncbi:hypothetical protein IAG25_32840 [Caballeronia sp. EK]|uniref:hypothetical protein n=1 Tax=Caballeronia sp. EK TaxID=2767469 RepID=UPI001654E764|nr:hypothetical protein [Caballeronia sp. EK]MBC8641613.1 hypothetical protein [Caballeronia sp. EK]